MQKPAKALEYVLVLGHRYRFVKEAPVSVKKKMKI